MDEEDEGSLQAVDDGEEVGHDAGHRSNLENAQHPGAPQDEELGKGLERQQPGVFEGGDFSIDTGKLLPQDPQGPRQEDEIDHYDRANWAQEAPDEPRLCIQPAAIMHPVALWLHSGRDSHHQPREPIAKGTEVQHLDVARAEVIHHLQVSDHEEEHRGLHQHPEEAGEEKVVQNPRHDGADQLVVRLVYTGEEENLGQEEAHTEMQVEVGVAVANGLAQQEGGNGQDETHQGDGRAHVANDVQGELHRELPRSHDDGQIHHPVAAADSVSLRSFKDHTARRHPPAALPVCTPGDTDGPLRLLLGLWIQIL